MVIQILLILFWLVLIPFLSGVWPAALLKKEYKSYGLIFLNGYIVNIAFFELTYLIFLLTKTSFFILWPTFGVVSVLVAIVSIIFGSDVFKQIHPPKVNAGMFVFAALVLFQFVMRFKNGVTDGDDAYFLSTALTTYQSGTMFKINGYTGYAVADLSDMRHALAGVPIYLATLAKLTKMHPTALAHTAFAIQAIGVHYMIIWEIGRILFKKTPKMVSVFACFVAIFNIFGNVSLYTAQTFLLTRSWQGKSIFANVFIPYVFLIFLMIADCEKKEKCEHGIFILLTTALFAASSMTTGAVFMLPILLFLGSVLLWIIRKQVSIPLRCALACIPMGIVGLLYVFMR